MVWPSSRQAPDSARWPGKSSRPTKVIPVGAKLHPIIVQLGDAGVARAKEHTADGHDRAVIVVGARHSNVWRKLLVPRPHLPEWQGRLRRVWYVMVYRSVYWVCVKVANVGTKGDLQLPEVVSTNGRVGRFLGSVQGWQEQSSKYRDDGDDNQELYKGKRSNRR